MERNEQGKRQDQISFSEKVVFVGISILCATTILIIFYDIFKQLTR